MKYDEMKEEKDPDSDSYDEKEKGKNILGMKLAHLNGALRKRFNIPDNVKGLIVLSVEPGSAAFSKGISRGNVIVEANQEKLETTGQLSEIVKKAREKGTKSLLMLIYNTGGNLFVAVPLEESK